LKGKEEVNAKKKNSRKGINNDPTRVGKKKRKNENHIDGNGRFIS
jgi:hypothetical protein